MKTVDDYRRELRFSLFLQELDKTTIRDILDEVSSECSTYAEAVEKFGEPEEYASAFPEVKTKRRMPLFMFIGSTLAILWIISNIVRRETSADDAVTLGHMLVTFLPALGIIALCILIDFLRALRRASKI
ncbi:hypothetical protein [Glutamicibacter sp. PS]|uniref:hypothetical protein n=1 Tax=Glutamicibacter sp. PS TaxID=3075634 RepID=UPI00283F82AC|nr:hypothetical protein [Glutamicibacter sp. PS]MDR4534686.1 hypothetical protein [Glutamicibacter sp. PS]